MVFAIKDVAELILECHQARFTKEMDLTPDCFPLNPYSASDDCIAAALNVLRPIA